MLYCIAARSGCRSLRCWRCYCWDSSPAKGSQNCWGRMWECVVVQEATCRGRSFVCDHTAVLPLLSPTYSGARKCFAPVTLPCHKLCAGCVLAASHLLSPAKITRKCHSADDGLSCCFPGQSGLGKSTLINTLFKSKISRKSVQPTSEERIPKTIEIKSITHGEAPHIPAGALAFGPTVSCVLLNLCSHLPKWMWSIQRCSVSWESTSFPLILQH